MEGEPAILTENIGVGVLVLGASAGGQSAIIAILRELPLDFDVPIVIVQHLPVEASTVQFYAKRLPFNFRWVDQESQLEARTVLLCPPRSCIELLPDRSFHLEPCERGALDKQIDRLLRSVARSFGHRAIAVVLTGMGNDGAAGARELHDAGGYIVVQAESSAEFAELPRSVIAAGAADLIVPLGDMAQVLLDLVAGAVRPRARSEVDAIENIFGTAGDIAALARDMDWSRTPLGPVLGWPAELSTIVRIGAQSPHLSAVWWGPELVLIYNEAYRRFLGISKHPGALGVSARETWREIWSNIGPKIEGVMKDGIAIEERDACLHIDRLGFVEEIFVNFAYSPIRDARGVVLGLHNTCWETTDKVVAKRRLLALRALAARSAGASAPREACEHAAAVLAAHPRDLPFGLLYLFDKNRRHASLAGAFGMAAGSAVAPHTIALVGARDTWALQRLVESTRPVDVAGVLLEDLERRVPELASLVDATPAGLVPRSVYVLPLRGSEDELPVGAFVAGLSPQRSFDDDYRTFAHFVAQQISAGLVEALARQRERERLDHLSELDRAKTEFFANVSHEFRTPLTLLLSPLEEIQRRRDTLPSGLSDEIDRAARNSRRLLRLVDNLLDFSQIEQRRQRAFIQPTDLASLTADIASAFRSAIERAGLTLRVECPKNLPLVPVDRDMWEKIVSNLLSNALKFTFEGEIVVRLRVMSLHVELVLSDTGIGIPKHELPNIFKRFHRVRGARARTIEGSGIGLAVVHDLVSRMGGQLQVRSTDGHGTTFIIWMPLKSFRQTFESDAAIDTVTRNPRIAAGIAEEAATWLEPQTNTLALDDVLGAPSGQHLRLAPGARVLVADDNADMRDYLQRLLGAYWQVTTAADGAQALQAARSQRPDLILADVMMPNVDGFALLRAVRDDESLKDTPVVFLTARAGEDTAIQGLLAGADDYLAKPFSARELIARVGGQIELVRARRRTQELNEFLVRFSDAVRGLSDPQAMADTACRMLLEQLGVDHAHWAEIDWATQEFVIIGSVHKPGFAPIEGRFPLAAWEPSSGALGEGSAMVVEDTQADSHADSAMRTATARMEIRAELAVPVLSGGRLSSVLTLKQRLPRRWTSEEIALVEAVAGRCWPEVERARAESALRQADKRYRAMTDNAPVLIWETDASGLVFCNRHYTDFFGAPLEAVRDMGWASFLHPDDADAYTAVYRSAFERRESYTSECRLRRADGEYRWLLTTGHPLGEGQFVGFSADITENKRAEAALRTSEERKAFLLKLGDALTPLRDPSEIKATASRLLGKHLGIARTFFAEIDGDEWIVGDVYDAGASSLESGRYTAAAYGRWTMDTLRAGSVVSVGDTATDVRLEPSERKALQRIGNAAVVGVPLLRHGEVVAVLSLHSRERREWTNAELELVREVADRTWPAVERARVEEALKRSEERLLSVAESGVVAVAFFDTTGAIIDANDAFLEMVGHSRAPKQH